MNQQTLNNKKNWPGANLETYMEMLADKKSVNRQKARKSLIALGKLAVSSLTQALQKSEIVQVRLEAVKILGVIHNTQAIPTLVKALEDKDLDVAWFAAEALRKFKKTAWPTLLHVLIKNSSYSVSLRRGAHHVFRNQKQDGFNNLLKILIKTLELESSIIPESTAIAANNIIKQMEINSLKFINIQVANTL